MDETPSSRRADWLRIAAVLAIALLVRGWLVTHTEVLARDSIEFIRLALRFESQPWGEVMRTSHQAPGYPLLILAAVKLSDGLGCLRTSEQLALCAQLVSAIAGLLTAIPMYFTGRRLAGSAAGFFAALIFQALPVCVRVTTDGLSEGPFFLFVASGLYFGMAAMPRKSLVRFLSCGVAGGLAYVTRPEGGEVVVAVGLATVLAGAFAREWLQTPLRLAALAAGVLPFVGAYYLTTGHLTRKPASVQMFQSAPKPVGLAAGGVPLAVFWNDAVDAGQSRAAWAARSVLFEANRAAHYLGLVLAAGGVMVLRRRLCHDPARWPPILLAIGHALLLWRMAYVAGYVSERHAMMIAFAATFGAGALFACIIERLPHVPGRRAMIAVAILACGLPSTLQPMHANRAGHRAAGEWLAAHASPGDEIIDPFAWARFYAGDVMQAPRAGGVRFVVVEASSNPHSRLQTLEVARQLAERGERVYQSPEQAEAGKATVAVYRVDAGR